jgi:hypothetical protein
MKVPLASLTHQLTHDSAITARHHDDERDGIRASEITVRFRNALTAAQQGLASRMPSWTRRCSRWWPATTSWPMPMRPSDAEVGAGALLTYQRYPQNFHENFNELNREQIFADILAWMARD